jgi:homospermidine synthase
MKLILIGCGSVGTAILELMTVNPGLIRFKTLEKIIIINPRPMTDIFRKTIYNEIKWPIEWVKIAVERYNITLLFNKYIDSSDIIIDVSVGTGTLDILKYVFKQNIHYINTSLETWESDNKGLIHGSLAKQMKFTTYNLHCKCNQLLKKYKKGSATVILEHGMNPGLISHFTKYAIEQLSKERFPNYNIKSLNDYARLCYKLNVRVIQCSEKDTQISKDKYKRKPTEFVSTWSPMGLMAEGLELIQIGYGTHEQLSTTEYVPRCGARNQFILPTRGIEMRMRSAVPSGKITGYIIPHGEGETLSRFLTYKSIYRPSTYYVYQHNVEAIESIEYLKQKRYTIPSNKLRVLYGNEIKSGSDEVGALLIMEGNKPVSYWAGTTLSLRQTKQLGLKISGPTSVQVAISVLAALNYCVANPKLSMIYPEQMDSNRILTYCKKYLGDIYSDYIDYHPKDFTYTANIIE